MKKDGSVLIEAVFASFILSITIMYTAGVVVSSMKSLKFQEKYQKSYNTLENLKEEIKYNYSSSEIEELIKGDGINLKYDDEFDEKLLYENIEDMEKGDDIVIKKSDNKEDYGISIDIIMKNNDEIIIKKNFVKSWWMGES
ncbi:hypothetical protein [Clostridium sp. BJN0001]|uniref:hypothetical protein n=1 Tax=Clostridium sp. BJN0001 TaxID=2930219 RepID=UPI001FD01128|nr:hypothetical protein [Clostridium sp. BJN0001]